MHALDPAPGSHRHAVGQVLRHLPRGSTLPDDAWAARHRVILWLLALHVPALGLFALWMGRETPAHVGVELATVAAAALGAWLLPGARQVRGSVASIGLLTCSALLTHFSGGTIEAHFHFFVMIIVISLYQEWVPFLLAVGYVAVHHGVVGVLDPGSVYNHPAAIAAPWTWAGIHAVFILAASVAAMVNWRLNELHRAAAREAEDRLGAVVTAAPVVLFATDAAGRLTLLQGRGLDALGLAPSALLGRPLERAFPGAPGLMDAVRLAALGETTVRMVALRDRALELRCAPLGPASGEDGVIGVATDVTEQRRAEAAERDARERLVQSLRENDLFKTRLLNTAAHELCTPLTPLKLQVELLRTRDAAGLSQEQRRSVDVLDRNLDRLGRLIQDVLDVARLQAGALPVARAEMDLGEAVQDAVDLFREQAARAGLTLESRVRKGLRVRADPHRVAQVLSNLLGNAMKFTPPGGRVVVEASATDDGSAAVHVRDTGIGLAREDLPKLFQPFSQLAGPEASPGGTGLGLHICKGIVEAHGGSIWAESPGPGQGATFGFTLPQAHAARGPEAAAAPA